MPSPMKSIRPSCHRFAMLTVGLIACLALVTSVAIAQDGGNNGGGDRFFSLGAVGGISVDAQGVLANSSVDAVGGLRDLRLKALQASGDESGGPSEMRKISLRRLEAAIDRHLAAGEPLPIDIRLLAGLQRIRYVFVDPEAEDIILAGPAEGWTVGPQGAVVGEQSGRPVLRLDDLLVALRTASGTVRSPISCSIDPTAEGLQRLQSFLRTRAKRMSPAVVAGIERSLGPQTIRVEGVEPTTHFARVLVAADYRMKRLAMDFESAPVSDLPSFLDLMKSGRGAVTNMMPRWWLTTNYEPLLKDEEGLAWELRGPGVKAMAEEDYFSSAGVRQRSAKASPLAQRWADNMTASYDALARQIPIFGELRNCIDLAVVAALVVKENLTGKAGFSMPHLTSAAQLPVAEFPAPALVDSKASFVKRGREWIISASGGVQVNPWSVVEAVETSDSLSDVRRQATSGNRDDTWWWD